MVRLTTRRWTVDEYDRMIEAGILTENDRVELLRGEIVDMSPIGGPHQSVVLRLNTLLAPIAPDRFLTSVQGAVRLASVDSEPEPDVALLVPRADFYSEKHPDSDDILLVIEVAQSSLERDRDIKIPLYAEAGIREAWLVDISNGVVQVFSNPTPDGYAECHEFARGTQLSPHLLPDIQLNVSDILG